MENLRVEGANSKSNMDIEEKRKYVDENVLVKYGKKASEIAAVPIFFSEAQKLIPLESEMCKSILSFWEINKYNVDIDSLINSTILSQPSKFIQHILTGRILRLIPGGVTILSVGINASLAKRFTKAFGHAISELSYSYIQLINNGITMEVEEVFSKEAIENTMDSYLLEYNKTVSN